MNEIEKIANLITAIINLSTTIILIRLAKKNKEDKQFSSLKGIIVKLYLI